MSLGPVWTAVILPPANLLGVGLAGLALPWRAGRWAGFACLALLAVLALPLTAGLLEQSLWSPALAAATPDTPGAVVILSADTASTEDAVEIGPLTLERLRRGAAFARGRGLPILLSGGISDSGGAPMATLMAASLRDDFGIDGTWQETRSEDTWENAQDSAELLRAHGIRAVYLVTHSWHMRRAALAFERAGIETVAVPVRLDHSPTFSVSDYLPRASALLSSFYCLHEWLGYVDYALFR